MRFDVIVIGGGPSGSYSALNLAKLGFKVLLLEKYQRGRYKTCAGGISPRTLSLLQQIPDEIIEREIYGVRLFSPLGVKLELRSPYRCGYTVFRSSFDLWLLEQAEEKGALVKNNAAVKGIQVLPSGVKVKVEEASQSREYEGDILIGAFGVEPDLSKQLDMPSPRCVIAAQAELALDKDWVDQNIGNVCELFFSSRYSESGYVWIFPKRTSITVGLCDRPDSKNLVRRLQAFILSQKLMRNKLDDADALFAKKLIHIHLNPNTPLEKTFGQRFLLVGDAAGLVEPFTGEGIYFALYSAKIASQICVEALENGDFTEDFLKKYQSTWRQALWKEIKSGLTIQKLLYGSKYDDKWEHIINYAHKNEKLKNKIITHLPENMSLIKAWDAATLIDKIKIFSSV